MHRPYAQPITSARPDVGLPEPRVVPWVLSFARLVSWPYLRLGLGFARVSVGHPQRLVDAFRGALAGDRRVVLAFRHPYGDEPQLLSWLFSSGIRVYARAAGVRLARAPHAVFVHGYEVPRWGGPVVRWILPRVGALPVHHSRLDSAGMARIRAAIEDGAYPLALSPEGQVSYTSDDVPRLEPGAVRLGLQAAERLASAGRSEHVHIVPISVHYRYGRRAGAALERLLCRLERFAGLAPAAGADGQTRQRLGRILALLLERAEHHYGLCPAPDDSTVERVGSIVDAALATGERMLGIAVGKGDSFARLYRIRQTGWDRVYLPPEHDPRAMSPLDRAVADRASGEAWYAMRHMELADFALYLRSDPPAGEAPLHTVVEYAQNLWDFANRLAGGTIAGRIEVRPKSAYIIVGEPVDLSERLVAYRDDRKLAIADALSALEREYRNCIHERCIDDHKEHDDEN